MNNMARISMLLIAAIVASSCSSRVPTDGFKNLHYGMSKQELQALGFNCEDNDFSCRSDAEGQHTYTLFGKEASVSIDTSEGNLSSINVWVDLSSDELIALYTKEFGRPKTFTYRSLGGQSEIDYWISGDRASISVARLVGRTRTSLLGVETASAEYRGPAATKELLEASSSNTVRGQDY